MGFVKKHLSWIILGLIALILVGVQIFWVGAIRSATYEENKKVIARVKSVRSLSRKMREIPTDGDLDYYASHLEQIQAEGAEVQRLWRDVTGGLNRHLRNGRVIHPRTGEPVGWNELFAEFLYRDQYEPMLRQTEGSFAATLEPYLEKMAADEFFAGNAELTVEAALRLAEENGARLARQRAHIWRPESMIPINTDTPFPPETPEKTWAEWRRFLIIRNVLRAVTSARVEMERTLNAKERRGPGEGAEAAEEEADDATAGGEVATTVLVRPAWRFVERVDRLEVTGPFPGTSELAATGDGEEETTDVPVVETKKKAKKKKIKALDSQYSQWLIQEKEKEEEVEEEVEIRYHDVFRVEMEITAHIRVVHAVMRELLASGGIFYVPQLLSTERFPDTEVMGMPQEEQPAKGGARPRETTEWLFRPAREVSKRAAFDYEPPVRATLVYEVYRFRYGDTVNNMNESINRKEETE